MSKKSDKPLFLCFLFASVSEAAFKYSILREIKILFGPPFVFILFGRIVVSQKEDVNTILALS